jgi:hypothetical protein
MADEIYVDPIASGGAAVIKIGGVCYQLVGPSCQPPSSTGRIEGSFDNCDDCGESSGSSSGSGDCCCLDAGDGSPICCYSYGTTARLNMSWTDSQGHNFVFTTVTPFTMSLCGTWGGGNAIITENGTVIQSGPMSEGFIAREYLSPPTILWGTTGPIIPGDCNGFYVRDFTDGFGDTNVTGSLIFEDNICGGSDPP